MRKDGVKQLMFLAVVVSHQGQGHLRFQCDLANGDRMVAVLGKQLFGCQQNGRTPVGRLWAAAREPVLGGAEGTAMALIGRLSKLFFRTTVQTLCRPTCARVNLLRVCTRPIFPIFQNWLREQRGLSFAIR